MTDDTTYQAISSVGTVIRTFAHRDQAVTWWDSPEGVATFPGASLQAVTERTIVMRRTLRRDRPTREITDNVTQLRRPA